MKKQTKAELSGKPKEQRKLISPEWKARILKILFGVLAVFTALILLLFFCRDYFIRKAVVSFLRQTTGVAVTMDDFHTSFWDGSITITNLKIANPKGYKEPYLLQADHCRIVFEPKTLFSENIAADEIRLSGLQVHLAKGEDRQLNLSVLNGHIQQELGKEEWFIKEWPGSNLTLNVRHLIVENGSLLTLRDDRSVFFLQRSLNCEIRDWRYKMDERSFAETLNDGIAVVEAKCDLAFNPQQIFLNFGSDILQNGAETGGNLLSPLSDLIKLPLTIFGNE